MKVFFFEDGCHTAGGTATFVRICSQSFPAQGMELRVINFGASDGECKAEWLDGTVVECGMNECRSIRRQAATILREFLRFQPDIVCLNDSFHFHDYHRPLARAFARHAAVVDLVETGTKTAWYHLRREPILDCLSGMAAISRTAAENTLAHLKPPFELRIIPYGLSGFPDRLRPRPIQPGGPLILTHAARMDEGVKRTSDLVRLSAVLDERGIEHRLQIFGAGDTSFYQKLIKELSARSVSLHPPVSRQRVLEVFGESDFVLLASVFEGFCLMILEGMSAGAVPIATRCGSAIEDMVQQGESGFIVPIGDVTAMADAVQACFRAPSVLAKMSNAAFASSRRFSATRMAENYRMFFGEAKSRTAAGLHPWPTRIQLPAEYGHWRTRLSMKSVKRFDALKATVRTWVKGSSPQGPAYAETVAATKRSSVR